MSPREETFMPGTSDGRRLFRGINRWSSIGGCDRSRKFCAPCVFVPIHSFSRAITSDREHSLERVEKFPITAIIARHPTPSASLTLLRALLYF
jgi:hypothetical protein